LIHTIGTWGAQFMNTAPALAVGAAMLLGHVALAATPARTGQSGKAAAAGSAKAAVQPAAPKGDPALGKDKADSERCVECHGQLGQGSGHPNSTEAKFAKLAGQKMPYIIKQVQDFRSGARKHDQMAIVARNLSDEDLVDIAAWFSSLPPMKGESGDVHEAGKALFEQGDTSRGIPACVSCHGAKGLGQGGVAAAPRLGGQEWKYLDNQLRAWRDGSRKNSPDGVMSQLAKALSDRDIDVVINYLAAQGQGQ
jgi:cytochrome c553